MGKIIGIEYIARQIKRISLLSRKPTCFLGVFSFRFGTGPERPMCTGKMVVRLIFQKLGQRNFNNFCVSFSQDPFDITYVLGKTNGHRAKLCPFDFSKLAGAPKTVFVVSFSQDFLTFTLRYFGNRQKVHRENPVRLISQKIWQRRN